VLFGNSEAKIAGGPSAKKKAKITSLREELKDSKEPLIGKTSHLMLSLKILTFKSSLM